MAIHVRKSSCTRIGARFNAKCCCITTLNGAALAWTDTVRYLGVYITAAHRFCCSLHNAKRSVYRAFNCILGKIAGENVIIELLRIKCLPCMYYGLEACPVSKSQIKSLHFAILIVHSTVGWTLATATVNSTQYCWLDISNSNWLVKVCSNNPQSK